MAITRHMVAKLPYVIEKDFQPIALIVHGHLMLAVSPKSDIKSVKELIEKAKANPGKLTNASSSNGSPGHVGGELFKFMTGTEIQHVPYRGGAPAINDLVAGHVDLMFESLNSISSAAKSGQVRALAVSGDKRSTAFPDLPTIAEAGVPDYQINAFHGILAPAGTPPAIVAKLEKDITEVLKSPVVNQKLIDLGFDPVAGSGAELAAIIDRDLPVWRDVVQRSGARVE